MTTINQQVLADLPETQAVQLKMLIERGIKVPPQPKVVEQFRQQLARGEKDLRVLARTLGDDTGIAGMLFKVVQSNAYRQYHPFTSVEHILQAIGLEQTRNIVQALALSAAFPQRQGSTALQAYWQRSRQVAELAMAIADRCRSASMPEPDLAYLAGVFHDCGVPVLMGRFPGYGEQLSLTDASGWHTLVAEDAKYFADHAVVGYFVGRHWRLPDAVAAAIRFHHDLEGAAPGPARQLTAVVQFAIELFLRDRQIDNPDWATHRHAALLELDIDPADENDLADDLLAQLSVAAD